MLAALAAAALAAEKPNILLIVADDLGYEDIGIWNGNITKTPVLNSLISEGAWLSDYYTYTICSPSRSQLNTGRDHWRYGWYDMSDDDNKCAAQNFTLLPQLMKSGGYATAAYGKWDIGFVQRKCTPTYAGHDEFLGYYKAAMADYWYHGDRSTTLGCEHVFGKEVLLYDISVANGTSIKPLPESMNGTYNTNLFNDAAVEFINRKAGVQPLFIYMAYMNQHDAAPFKFLPQNGLQAPCSSVDSFGHIHGDGNKTAAAMLHQLDTSVGHLRAALEAKNQWHNTLVIFVSDNGGPLDHAYNRPLRGGKHTFWEGGIRVAAFISGPVYQHLGGKPGVTYSGMLHATDWYRTLTEGAAGLTLPENTGTIPPSGYNALDAIIKNTASPRTEVITQVNNSDYSATPSVIRVNDYKLIRGKPGDSLIQNWVQHANNATKFEGARGNPDGACRAPGNKRKPLNTLKCDPYCLFNVVDDISESKDLSQDPQYADIIAQLNKRLDEQGATGAGQYDYTLFPDKTTWNAARDQVCEVALTTKFTEPMDF